MRHEWVQWWCCTWRWAHPAWKAQFTASEKLVASDYDFIVRSRHSDFLRCVGIVPSQPPEPCEELMLWLALDATQREEALSLTRRICFAPQNPSLPASDPCDLWCQRLAKAIRPGLWLNTGVNDERLLLGAWIGESCWSRLRLTWTPGEAVVLIGDMPRHRLQTLWRAVLWRVATP